MFDDRGISQGNNKKIQAIDAESTGATPRLQSFLDEALRTKPALRILEAGCGSASQLHFPGKQIHMTGIDLSQKQLDRNPALDVKICADIQNYSYQPNSFDLIICYWVLEHLSRPDLALLNFVPALDTGGYIILALPNVLSVKGLVTKYAPFPLHVWVYRFLLRRRIDIQEDMGPFRTYIRYSVRPQGIRKFAKNNGLQVRFLATYDALSSPWYFSKGILARILRECYRGVKIMAKVASFGLLGDSDFYIVMQKCS
jgi:SAM-dependent methyltransferase